MFQGKLNLKLVALLVALCIVTFAVWHKMQGAERDAPVAETATPVTAKGNVPDLLPTDHLRGNPEATILIVVYSDFGCPFCSDFHGTMQRLMDMYGTSGQVAWVFRHMPLTKLHPESATYALASECVAQQAGNRAFWTYADLLYDKITPEETASSETLTDFAEQVGVSRPEFITCMQSSNLMSRVEANFNEALGSGAAETPYVVFITPYEQIATSGAQPFPAFAGTVKTMLRVLGNDSRLQSDELMPNFFDEMRTGSTSTARTTGM
jgi:protein-disulfide isomerase